METISYPKHLTPIKEGNNDLIENIPPNDDKTIYTSGSFVEVFLSHPMLPQNFREVSKWN